MNFLKDFQSLIKQEGFIRYFKNTFWLLFERILRILLGLFIGVWVVRYLGPEDFGLFSYVNSIIYFFIVISTLGLDGVVVRELVRGNYDENIILGSSLFLRLLVSFIIVLIIFSFLYYYEIESDSKLLIAIVSFSILFQGFRVIDVFFQSKVLSKYVVFSGIISLALSSLLKILFIVQQKSVLYFGLIVVVEGIMLASCLVFFYKKNGKKFRELRVSKNVCRKLLGYGWPFILSGIMIALYMRVDQIMLKFMVDEEEVGIYSAAVRLSELWYFIPVAIVSSVFPAIVNAKKQSLGLYHNRLQRLYDLLSILSISIAIAISFSSTFLINLLYGEAYSKSAHILMIHIWSGLFVFLGVASEKWLLNENLQKIFSFNTLIGSVINILFNYYLINNFGAVGAAYSTLISQFIASYLCLWFFNKTRMNFIKMTRSIFLVNHIKFFKNV